MLKFFKNHPLARNWFRNPPHPRLDRGAVTPFQMIGDVYYVGNGNVSSHLITSSEGRVTVRVHADKPLVKGVVKQEL